MVPEHNPPTLMLPAVVCGMTEVRRLQRELERLEGYFVQGKLRAIGGKADVLKVSRLLDEAARANNLNLLHAPERQILAGFLHTVASQAPVIHMSFAAEPMPAFTAKLVGWLRANIHPHTLLQPGLQPSIAVGCEVRTPNRVFDFSLRRHLSGQRAALQQALAAPKVPRP